ncbi:hypothetical protein CLV67_115254 [Actinoplanes italicus]|uniref:Uncharacterized protein n=1 Tax=Actinoplanes italicus TaxID=113567 RepID=A0A2T0K4E8_9ACTN|nr:hypothetical protein CLV67_115254 [Actinoplanes italicus]
MAQQTPGSPADSRGSSTASGVAVITAALMVGLAPFATSRPGQAGPGVHSGSRPEKATTRSIMGASSATGTS